MKKYFCICLVIMSVLLTFPMQCHANGHGHYSHGHGGGWSDFAAGMFFGVLGLGVLTEITRPHYPPPQVYMQPVPQETIRPGYMYYCVYSGGYYPYTPGCPGGWLQVVPIPQPQPQR